MQKSIASATLCVAATFGQSTKFEVASIKPSSPDAHGSSMMTDKAGNLNVLNAPIRALITMAYGIRNFQLSGGPGWVGTDRYDVIAKPEKIQTAPPPPDARLTDDERNVRDQALKEQVRNLLADRFGLVVHKEAREEQIYFLTVAKGGPKLTVVANAGQRQGISSNRGRTQGFAATPHVRRFSLHCRISWD